MMSVDGYYMPQSRSYIDFYINQYEYFLKYGLRLQKRDELTLSNDRIGTFFHKAMETFVTTIRENNLSFCRPCPQR